MTRGKVPTPVVLVVDDEALIRWSVAEALAGRGYGVRQAGTAAEARTVLNGLSGVPVVVILDLRLPDAADLSFLREVRRAWPDAAVIMMSAHGTADDAREALSCGAFRFIDKPFDVAGLAALVDEAAARAVR